MPKVIGINRFIDTPDLTPALAQDVVPPGTILTFGSEIAPSGFLACDGSQVSRTTYAALFAAIGTRHGVGDGSTTFHLPSYSGKFLRCMDFANGNDPDRTSRVAAVAGTFTVGGATIGVTPTVTISSTANLAPGMIVTLGGFIPASTVVRTIVNSTTFVMGNLANTANVSGLTTGSGLTLTFQNAPAGNYVGSVQSHAYMDHTHDSRINGAAVYQGATSGSGANNQNNTSGQNIGGQVWTTTGGTGQATTETRPLNAYAYVIIKT